MGSATGLLLLLMPVAVHLGEYTEGQHVAGEVLLCDCLYDMIGTDWARFNENFNYKSFTVGTKITYIEAINLKEKWPADIRKIDPNGGGVNASWITFKLHNQKNHGAKFQIKVYGILPVGTKEAPLTGDCFGKRHS